MALKSSSFRFSGVADDRVAARIAEVVDRHRQAMDAIVDEAGLLAAERSLKIASIADPALRESALR